MIYATPTDPEDIADTEVGRPPYGDQVPPDSHPQQTLQNNDPLAIWKLARQLHRQRLALKVICGYYSRSHLLLALLLVLFRQSICLRYENTFSHTYFAV